MTHTGTRHVCHVITRLIVGGAQENTLLSCEGLAQCGWQVTLIAGPTTGPEGSLVGRARAGGYRYIEVPELVRRVNPWLDARACREIAAHLATLRPDVVHTHSSKAGILGRFAAKRADVPVVVHTIHGMSFNRTQSRLVRTAYAWLERRAAKHTHTIVTVADAMIEQTVAACVAPRSKMRTIYSGMDVAGFTPNAHARAAARAKWGVADHHIVIGAVARLFRRKGYEQLIPIMSRVAAHSADARFVWVGDGAQRAEYEHELDRLGLRERTTLAGLVPPAEVAAQLAGFDILAHASQWEGLPRAVVQSLLMRVPAVAFDIDGTPEVIHDGRTGRVVPLGDLDGFADALLELCADEPRRDAMGRAGRELCLERFDHRRMVDALDALYEELLTNRLRAGKS